MVVCVLEECQDDPSNILFLDMEKLPINYKKAVELALKDDNKSSTVDFDSSYSYGEDNGVEEAMVEPPTNVDDCITLLVV